MALAGDQASAPAWVYGGTDAHARKGIDVFGWYLAGEVMRNAQPW